MYFVAFSTTAHRPRQTRTTRNACNTYPEQSRLTAVRCLHHRPTRHHLPAIGQQAQAQMPQS